jgi:hypothetical protein
MTPEEYVHVAQEFAQRRDYASLIDFAERFGPEVEDRLTADQVRILRVHLKHADMITSKARSQVNTA